MKLQIISLYRSDYLKSLHTRDIARRINKNHVTILPHLRSLEKERILNCSKIGKNTQYSLNLNNILTKTYLEMSELLVVSEFIKEHFIIHKLYHSKIMNNSQGLIILFGSYAKGKNNSKSDIDLLVSSMNIAKKDQKKVEFQIGKKIDIKMISDMQAAIRKKDPLILEGIKDHIILQNPGLFVNALWTFFQDSQI